MGKLRGFGLLAGVIAGIWLQPGRGAAAFNVKQKWNDWTCASNADRCFVGDFNGDGRDDVAAVIPDGRIFVAESTGSAFVVWPFAWSVPNNSGKLPIGAGYEYRAGDVNNDGLDDVVIFTRGISADVHVALAQPQRQFTIGWNWHTTFAGGSDTPFVGDVNGDGCADILTFTKGFSADVWVAKANPCGMPTGFADTRLWHTLFSPGSEQPGVGDFDGDGMTDIATFVGLNDGAAYVARSFGREKSVFQCEAGNPACIQWTRWHTNLCKLGGRSCYVGDFNGDGQADVAEINPSLILPTAAYFLSDGTRLSSGSLSLTPPCTALETCLVGDFDGNGRDDFVALTRQSGNPGDASVTLSGGDHEVLNCATQGCSGMLSFPSHGWVDTDVRLSDVGNGPHTIGFRVMMQFPNSDWNTFITNTPHHSTGDYAIGKNEIVGGSAATRLFTSFELWNEVWWNPSVPSTGKFEGGTWYHVAVTIANGMQRTYVNGVEAFRAGNQYGMTLPAAWNNNGEATFRIGADTLADIPQLLWRGFGNVLYGMVDNVAIYNRALSPEEIGALATKTSWTGNETGLIAAWNFDYATTPPANPKLERPLSFHGNAKRVTLAAGQSPTAAMLTIAHDTPAGPFGGDSNYAFLPPLEPGLWHVVQGQDRPDAAPPGPSHRGYASFCLDLGRAGVPSRGQEVRATARGQVILVRNDQLDTPNLPPYPPSGVCPVKGGCSSYGPDDVYGRTVRLVQGCTPCSGGGNIPPFGGVQNCQYLPNIVVLRHGPNEYTGYEHLMEYSVPPAILTKLACYYEPNCVTDSVVAAGERIGLIGRSGAGSDHLHFAASYRSQLFGQRDSNGTALGDDGQTGDFSASPAPTGEYAADGVSRSRSLPTSPCGYMPAVSREHLIQTRRILFSRYTQNGVTITNSVPLDAQDFTWTP